MKSQSEIQVALEQFNKINNTYNSIELSNSAVINWVKQLNLLTTEFCETKYWDMLIEKIEYVKSLKIS